MDKLKLIKETLAMSESINKDFFSEAEPVWHTDTLILDILQSEFDCMESILILLAENKFEDSFILLRHILETFLYFWLMLEGKLYRRTRTFNIIPNPGSTVKEARDRTFEKWVTERKAGHSRYKDVVNIEKGRDDAIIRVTYQWKGLFSSKDKSKSGTLVPYYIFAFQRYEPRTRFLANLPSIRREYQPTYREIMKDRYVAQKTLYSRYFYFDSIIKNLKLNDLVSGEQADRIKVHYNFFSSFLHPNKRIIRAKTGTFAFSLSGQIEVLSELVLLYLCMLQFLYLSKVISHFKRHYPKGKYEDYEKQAELLDASSNDLWFFDNAPSQYDVQASETRKWWLKQSGGTVDKDQVFYYTDPIERMTRFITWKSRTS
jgi:hypothetical protein